jgi:hypothetical protein
MEGGWCNGSITALRLVMVVALTLSALHRSSLSMVPPGEIGKPIIAIRN